MIPLNINCDSHLADDLRTSIPTLRWFKFIPNKSAQSERREKRQQRKQFPCIPIWASNIHGMMNDTLLALLMLSKIKSFGGATGGKMGAESDSLALPVTVSCLCLNGVIKGDC